VAQVEVVTGGSRLVTRGQDGDAHLWDAGTGAHLRRIDVTWQRGLAVSPDGRFLVWPREEEKVKFKDPGQPNVIYTGSRLRMLDLETGHEVERFGGFEGDAHALFFTSGGKGLITVDFRDGAVRLWDVATGKAARSFRVADVAAPYTVWRAVLSPDGKTLAATYQRSGRGLLGQHAVKLWDVATGKPLHDLPGHYGYVEAVAFSPDGSTSSPAARRCRLSSRSS
jgi:WD40 repeat protein